MSIAPVYKSNRAPEERHVLCRKSITPASRLKQPLKFPHDIALLRSAILSALRSYKHFTPSERPHVSLDVSGKISALQNLICWMKVPVASRHRRVETKLLKKICEIRGSLIGTRLARAATFKLF